MEEVKKGLEALSPLALELLQLVAPGRLEYRVQGVAADRPQLDVPADEEIGQRAADPQRQGVHLVAALARLLLLRVEDESAEVGGPDLAEAAGRLEGDLRVPGLGQSDQPVNEPVQRTDGAVLGEALGRLELVVEPLELGRTRGELATEVEEGVHAAGVVVARVEEVQYVLTEDLM